MTKKPTFEELEQRVKELEKEVETYKILGKDLLIEKKFSESLTNSLPGVFYLFDENGKMHRWNENLEKVTKYSADEISKMSPTDFFDEKDKKSAFHTIQEVFAKGKANVELDLISKSGKKTPHYFTGIKTSIDNILYLVGMGIDITERKRAEEALRESEKKYRLLADNASDVIWTRDMNLNLTYLSPSIEELTGYSVEESMALPNSERMTPASMELMANIFEEELKLEAQGDADPSRARTIETEMICKDGSTVWIEVTVKFIRNQTGQAVRMLGISRDFTERKQAEEALRESEEKYRLLVKNIPSIVYKGYKDWSVDFFDEKIESLTGFNNNEFNSRRMKWIDIIVEEDIEAARKIFIQAFKTDKSYIREYRIISKTGDINWIHERGQIVCDKKGEIEYVNGVLFDITDRRQMQEELLKAKKLESVGTLAGGIAHDFNNLLTIILGNIELAEDDIKPEVGISECLAEAEKASIQAQALTKQLITFAKGGAPVKKIGSIGDLIKETTNLTISKSNVKCDFLISHDLWPVEFDEGQMKHAIKNMIDNAVESMPDEGTIDVRAENINITAEQGLPLLEGKYVKISIRDHGVGIPEEHLSKIFDPYFSTKEMGIQKGMGLGLAITYSIINRHDGYITLESKVGVGTTFTLFLPAHEKEIRELKPLKTHKPEKPSIRTGRILVMDDEESIRKLSKRRLSILGYESELAKDGTQAIEMYKKSMDSGQPFDAVILDLTVKGGMGGKDAIKALLEIDPQVKAIVSSGYSNDPAITNFRAYGFTGALPKPNTNKELIAVLKNITKE